MSFEIKQSAAAAFVTANKVTQLNDIVDNDGDAVYSDFEVNQDWDNETTECIFPDKSKICFSGSDMTIQ